MESRFEVRFSDNGRKSLSKLSNQDAALVLKKLAGLKTFSVETANIKQLKGTRNTLFRMRVGDLRVIFEVERKIKRVWILFVGYRGGVYRSWGRG